MKKKICAVYGEGSVTDWMCQKLFVKFHAGDFSLGDAPLLGRPVEIDSDQIKTLIENNQCYTMRDSWHTQNIQTNKVIGENEKCVFYYTEKTIQIFFANPIHPKVELVDYIVLFLIFEDASYCFLQWLHHSALPPTVSKGPPFSTSSPLLTSCLFDGSPSNRWEVISHCGLICIFLMIGDVEHLFMYLLIIWISSFLKK